MRKLKSLAEKQNKSLKFMKSLHAKILRQKMHEKIAAEALRKEEAVISSSTQINSNERTAII